MREWPRVRSRTRIINAVEHVDYCVDLGTIHGKRRCEFFGTKTEADDRASALRAERKQLGEDAFALTPEQKRDAVTAFRRLNGQVVTLTELVGFWLDRTAGTPRSLSQVQDELLKAQEERGLRAASLTGTRTRYAKFIEGYSDYAIGEISSLDIKRYLDCCARHGNLTTKAGTIRYLSVLFNFAMKRGYLKKNPMDQIERPRLKYKVPEFLGVDQVDAIFREAMRSDPAIVAKFALGFFAGIRPEELKRLEWSDINVENRLVTIRAEVAKCGVPRHVTMSDNLKDWMMFPHRANFCVNGFDDRRKKICQTVGIDIWPHDAMRHTFATMHLAAFENADKTAFELGHTQGVKLLYRHYRGLATKADAERYWRIEP